MGKRVTIHDIAREAGVSAATVSYVINDTQGQTISEETKNKIWHVINMFNYKPNVFAKNLRSSGRKLIAVCKHNRGYIDKAEFVSLLEGLARSLNDDFDLIFVNPPFGKISSADVIIAYNVSRETFYGIGNANYIPLIAVNVCVDDKLFFQVTPDFKRLKQKADGYFKGDYSFVCAEPADKALKEQILNAFESVVFIGDDTRLTDVGAENIFTVSGLIAEHFKSRNVCYEDIYPPVCKQTADCILKALSRETFDIHTYTV